MQNFTKKSVIAALVVSAVSVPAIAGTLDAKVDYKDGSYKLDWQSSSAVSVMVNDVDSHETKQLVVNSKDTQLSWQANADSRHYFTLVNAEGDSITLASRLIPLQGGRNFRDLGGYKTTDGKTVKWGKLYRSGVLAGLTEQDYQLIEGLNIETVVDFRTNSERSSEQTHWQASPVEMITKDYEMEGMDAIVQVLRDPELNRAKLEGFMANMYPHILDDQKQNYTAMFDRMVNKDGGLLFHCTAGKDRTGISAALILTALGVDRQTVINDYLATNIYLDPTALQPKDSGNVNPEHAAMMKFFASLPQDMVQPLMGVTQPLIEAAIDAMEAKHGSVLEYIKQELDVSDEDIAELRAKYLM